MSNLSADDKTFLKKAAQGGMGEVMLGKLATVKASSNDVKMFGQHMVTDHTNANSELMAIAKQKKISLPKSPDPDSKSAQTRLKKVTGTAFDKVYIDHMVNDHVKDVADFQKEADQGQDPDVKAFAAKTLPTLKQHLQMAKNVQSGRNMSDNMDMNGTAGSGTDQKTDGTSNTPGGTTGK